MQSHNGTRQDRRQPVSAPNFETTFEASIEFAGGGALAVVEAVETAAVVTSPGGERPEPRRVLVESGALGGESLQLDGAVGRTGGENALDMREAGGEHGKRLGTVLFTPDDLGGGP